MTQWVGREVSPRLSLGFTWFLPVSLSSAAANCAWLFLQLVLLTDHGALELFSPCSTRSACTSCSGHEQSLNCASARPRQESPQASRPRSPLPSTPSPGARPPHPSRSPPPHASRPRATSLSRHPSLSPPMRWPRRCWTRYTGS